ncbi:hypothetical protein [Ferrovum myxofaciens]|uniref:hypothetical protein n=1 Tax=Ferrovum myxofaciens TaxID=416213 RepID=UPI0023547847|nr:hypothetical protein [Ferrovum myxofaciens]
MSRQLLPRNDCTIHNPFRVPCHEAFNHLVPQQTIGCHKSVIDGYGNAQEMHANAPMANHFPDPMLPPEPEAIGHRPSAIGHRPSAIFSQKQKISQCFIP